MASSSEDTDVLRRAYEQFMMKQGGGDSKKVEKHGKTLQALKEEKEAKEQEQIRNALAREIKRAEKEFIHIFNRFVSRTKNEWMELDDQAYEVVKAISSIRSRLPMETKIMNSLEKGLQKNPWSDYGVANIFEQHRCLNTNDVQLALSHDLIQHEKMMEALRRLLANLSDCHEALMRILDEIMKHSLECEESFGTVEVPVSFQKASSLSNLMADAISMMSLELYRKQNIAQIILDSSEDDILKEKHNDPDQSNDQEMNQKMNWTKQWDRAGKYSCIDKKVLTEVMNWN